MQLSSAIISHMPEYFDDSETFNPGRFDPDSVRQVQTIFTVWPLGYLLFDHHPTDQTLSLIFPLELVHVHVLERTLLWYTGYCKKLVVTFGDYFVVFCIL